MPWDKEEVYMRKIKIIPVVISAMLMTSLFAQSACAAALPDILDIVASTATNVLDAAENAGSKLSDAADMVIDKAGNVIDMASEGAAEVTEAGKNAAQILQEKGEELMKIVNEELANIDLPDQDWKKVENAVDAALEKASEAGLLGDKSDSETIRAIASLILGVVMYSYQYSDGEIDLKEFVSSLSEVIISEGIPAGVGYVVSQLPIPIPNADKYAEEAALYLLSKAQESGLISDAE